MLVLAIDTSGRQGSVALCRGDADHFEVLQLSKIEHGTYSARLMPTIAEALQVNHLVTTDVDGFVVVSGPGSFTGLRVGLATVKGLCEVLRKPLATISGLEAIVVTYGSRGETVTAVLDAGRGEAYIGEYRVLSGRADRVREYVTKLEEFAAAAAENRGALLTPAARVAELLQGSTDKIRLVPPVLADEIGRIGLHKLLAGDVADPATVDVNYIRRSDAEIFFAPKR